MKKLTKVIAAVSAAAMLAIPANMSAFAYRVDTGKSFSNPLINYDFSAGRGQRWEYENVQGDLPALTRTILEAKGKYTYYATTDTRCNEYGNCDIFALLPLDVATSETINNARPYIDNLSVKSKTGDYYALSLEYSDVSRTDSHRRRPSIPVNPDACDYALRMLEGPYLQDVLNHFYIDTPENINYDYIRSHGGYTGNIYLDNHYIAGMRLSSSDPYTTFETPALEENPKNNGKGFRTRITFHISDPTPAQVWNFGVPSYVYGSTNYDVLKDLKITCNGDTSYDVKNYIGVGGISKKTLTVPNKAFTYNTPNYTGIVLSPDVRRTLTGSELSTFKSNNFIGYRDNRNTTLNIYVGKNMPINDSRWSTKTGAEKFAGFLSGGGKAKLKNSATIKNLLRNGNVKTVYFFDNATAYTLGAEFYHCSANDLLNILNG